MRLLFAAALLVICVPVPASAAAQTRADYVIVAGAPGLRWDDVSEQATPTLWRLAQRGSIGSLTVRSAHVPTCPGDGWVTLGAGNFAARTADTVEVECPPLEVAIERPDELGGSLPDQPSVVNAQHGLPYGAVPGALAESVRCTTAVGAGAAVAAARPFGRVDRYVPTLPDEATALLSTCILSIVELGTISAAEPSQRAEQAEQADALLARLDAERPANSTIVVAGVSDTGLPGRLHLVCIDGPGWDRGWLTSVTTGRRDGYLELVDLAPTALRVLGREPPERIFAGAPAASAPGRPDDLTAALAALADADRRASAALGVSRWFFTGLAALQIALFVAMLRLLQRKRSPRGAETVLIAAGLVLPSAIMADAFPWWRSGLAGPIFIGITLALTALLTFGVTRLPRITQTLTPLGVVSSIAAMVICLDLMTGSRLQLNGVVGYSALQGGRFAGVGIVVMGVFIAGALMAAGWLAHVTPQRYRTISIVGIGAVAIVLMGSPNLGADAGGAVALTAGVCLAAALAAGGWLTFTRLAWAVLAGLVVTLGFALVDIGRPVEHQGSLGRLLNQFSEGTASLTLHRVGVNNVSTFVSSALTILAIAAAVFVWAVLMRPWGGLKRLFGIYPAVRATATGMAVATLIAGVFGGAALNVAGAAAATAVPLLTLTALRVLEHAADRTPGLAGTSARDVSVKSRGADDDIISD